MPRRRATRKKAQSSGLSSILVPGVPHVPLVAKQAPKAPTQHDENICAPWLDSISEQEYVSAEARLHDEITAYMGYITETPEEHAVVAHVMKLVDATLRKPFRQCEVRVFGSTDTGLRLPGSDIDLIIDAADVFDVKNMLTRLSGILREKVWCKSVNTILGARIPIISFSTTPEFGSLKIDVGINNFKGLETGEFVKGRLRDMPALRPLAFVIKKALALRDLNDASRSGISSFAVVCMCVFYLQLNPHHLSQDLLSDPSNKRSLGTILRGFLRYYSQELPYQAMYISLSQGRLVPKNTASWINSECYDRLVIQCPCNTERNITATLTARNYGKIRGILAYAHQVISSSAPSSRGVLNSLVSVDTKFIDYREHMRQLVESDGFRDDQGGSSSRVGSGTDRTHPLPSVAIYSKSRGSGGRRHRAM